MKPDIVFLDEYSLAGRDLTAVKALGNYTGYETTTPDQTVARCAGADIVITNKVCIDAAAMEQLPRLRLICVAATGMNNIDLAAAAERGIEVRNAAGYSTHSVAETTLGSAIALLRETTYYDHYFKSGGYAASSRLFNFDRPTRQLHGRNWGIIGMGTIGREVARLAAAFGCDVRYTSTSGAVRPEILFMEATDACRRPVLRCRSTDCSHGLTSCRSTARSTTAHGDSSGPTPCAA